MSLRNDALSMLREGLCAVQLFVGDAYAVVQETPRRVETSLWSCDPWQLIGKSMPAKTASLEHVEGVTMGARMLLSLVGAVEELAGVEAVAKLHVVLHCNDEQEEAVVADLRGKNFFGLSRENVVVVVECRKPAHEFDVAEQKFVPKLGGIGQVAGTGFCMMQLTWSEEAYVLAEAEGDVASPAPAPSDVRGRRVSVGTTLGTDPEAVLDDQLMPASDGRHQLKGSVLDFLERRGCR